MNFESFVTAFADSIEGINAANLSENTALDALPQWDSLAMLLTIDLVEENYGVTLNSREIRNCNTLGELFGLITTAPKA